MLDTLRVDNQICLFCLCASVCKQTGCVLKTTRTRRFVDEQYIIGTHKKHTKTTKNPIIVTNTYRDTLNSCKFIQNSPNHHSENIYSTRQDANTKKAEQAENQQPLKGDDYSKHATRNETQHTPAMVTKQTIPGFQRDRAYAEGEVDA